MKHSKKQDKQVIKRLKEQMKADKSYNNQFVEARADVRERQKLILTAYERFKKGQEKERENSEKLREYLTKKTKS